MPALLLHNCCGCIELRTGCFIIGILNMISDVINVIRGFFLLVVGGAVAANAEEKDDRAIGALVMLIAIIMLLFLFLDMAFTCILLIGLHKKKRGHIKFFLIFSVVFLIINVIALFAQDSTFLNILTKIINIIMTTYIILVIRSYYYKMHNQRPAIYSTA